MPASYHYNRIHIWEIMRIYYNSIMLFILLGFVLSKASCQANLDSIKSNSNLFYDIDSYNPSTTSKMTLDGRFILDFQQNIIVDTEMMAPILKCKKIVANHPKKSIVLIKDKIGYCLYSLRYKTIIARPEFLANDHFTQFQFAPDQDVLVVGCLPTEDFIIYDYSKLKIENRINFRTKWLNFRQFGFKVMFNRKIAFFIKDSYIEVKSFDNQLLYMKEVSNTNRMSIRENSDNTLLIYGRTNAFHFDLENDIITDVDITKINIGHSIISKNYHLLNAGQNFYIENLLSNQTDTIQSQGEFDSRLHFPLLNLIGSRDNDALTFYNYSTMDSVFSIKYNSDLNKIIKVYQSTNKLFYQNSGKLIEFDVQKRIISGKWNRSKQLEIEKTKPIYENVFVGTNYLEFVSMFPGIRKNVRSHKELNTRNNYIAYSKYRDAVAIINKVYANNQVLIIDLVNKDTVTVDLLQEDLDFFEFNLNSEKTKLYFRRGDNNLVVYDITKNERMSQLELTGIFCGLNNSFSTLYTYKFNESKRYLEIKDLSSGLVLDKVYFDIILDFRMTSVFVLRNKVLVSTESFDSEEEKQVLVIDSENGLIIDKIEYDFTPRAREISGDSTKFLIASDSNFVIYDLENEKVVIEAKLTNHGVLIKDQSNNYDGTNMVLEQLYFVDDTLGVHHNIDFNIKNSSPYLANSILQLSQSSFKSWSKNLDNKGFVLEEDLLKELMMEMELEFENLSVINYLSDTITALKLESYRFHEAKNLCRKYQRLVTKQGYIFNIIKSSENKNLYDLILTPFDSPFELMKYLQVGPTNIDSINTTKIVKILKKWEVDAGFNFFQISKKRISASFDEEFLEGESSLILLNDLQALCEEQRECFGFLSQPDFQNYNFLNHFYIDWNTE